MAKEDTWRSGTLCLPVGPKRMKKSFADSLDKALTQMESPIPISDIQRITHDPNGITLQFKDPQTAEIHARKTITMDGQKLTLSGYRQGGYGTGRSLL